MRSHIARLLAAAALAVLVVAAPARGAGGLTGFDVRFLDSKGEASLEAGSHPYQMKVSFNVNNNGGFVDEQPRDVIVSQAPGFVGNPTAVPPCATVDFLTMTHNAHGDSVPDCPDSSAVGVVVVQLGNSTGSNAPPSASVFNLEPPPGVAAKLGFWVAGVPVSIELGVNESPPYNVVGGPTNISQVLEVLRTDFTLWGVPADPSHDALRGRCLEADGTSSGKCPANLSEKPFLTLPRACQEPLRSTYRATFWQGGVDAGSALTHEDAGNPRPMNNCGKLAFGPRVSSQVTNRSAEGPSGLDLAVTVDDEGLTNPTGQAGSDIKKLVLALPEGMTLNPSQAEGLGVCSEQEFEREKIDTPFGAGCPSSSKVGTLEAESPLLEGRVLHGSVFVARPYENRFGALIALFIVLREPERGVIVKLASKVEPDPRTGQIVSITDDLPQLPVSRFRLHLREGGRSPLITPARCGDYQTTATFTPYANPANPYTTTSTFNIDSGVGGGSCPTAPGQPFEPGFEAGSVSNSALVSTPYLLRFTRRDGDQDLTRFDATLPPGATAKLAGVSQCPDASIAAAKAKTGREEQANPSCPANSRIGGVIAGAGVGSQLTYVPGSIYLAGPVGAAPLSVVAVVPAVAGPFDVGTVVTRMALAIDPKTGQAKVDGALSDPIPHILAGIPLRVRDIRASVDRPDFTRNPTSCNPFAFQAAIWGGGSDVFSSADDSPVSRSALFQVSNCAGLGFKPKLSINLHGGTKRGGHPALKAVLTPRPGDANIAGAVVTLPHSAFLEQSHIRTICTRVQFAAGAGNGAECPKGSQYGFAKAWTPILDGPAVGPVFLRSSNHHLPDLVIALQGPPSAAAKVEVSARIDSIHGGIRSSFESVPDLPVSRFILEMRGGKKGLIVNSRNLCGHKSVAKADLTGQNGRVHQSRPVVKANCGKKPK